MHVNPGHHQHHRDKAQNSGSVPPIPGRLATLGQGPKFRVCPSHSGTVGNSGTRPEIPGLSLPFRDGWQLWDKAQNSGSVPPIPGRLATLGQGPKFRVCPAHSGTVGNYDVLYIPYRCKLEQHDVLQHNGMAGFEMEICLGNWLREEFC